MKECGRDVATVRSTSPRPSSGSPFEEVDEVRNNDRCTCYEPGLLNWLARLSSEVLEEDYRALRVEKDGEQPST
jgi:hypothetical protein